MTNSEFGKTIAALEKKACGAASICSCLSYIDINEQSEVLKYIGGALDVASELTNEVHDGVMELWKNGTNGERSN